jgi:hypothetical protein
VPSASARWKVVGSPIIEVDPRDTYFIESKLKPGNIQQATLMITEFDADYRPVSINLLDQLGDSASDWRSIEGKYLPSGNLVRYVQFQIWYDKNTDQPLPNEIPLEFLRYGTLKFTSEFYEQQTLSYKKIDETKYIVNIPQSSATHVIVFPQIFNSLWVAKIDGKEYRPSPLYNSLNAFVVDKDGTMEISYKPQQSFHYAVSISLISLGIAVAYSIYEWKSKKIRKSVSKAH